MEDAINYGWDILTEKKEPPKTCPLLLPEKTEPNTSSVKKTIEEKHAIATRKIEALVKALRKRNDAYELLLNKHELAMEALHTIEEYDSDEGDIAYDATESIMELDK